MSSGSHYFIRCEISDKAGNITSKTVEFDTLKTYTVSYDANGGTGAPSSQTKIEGTPLPLSDKKPTRSGWTFFGWGLSRTTDRISYFPEAMYTINEDLSLYAIWGLQFSNGLSITSSSSNGSSSELKYTGTYFPEKCYIVGTWTYSGYSGATAVLGLASSSNSGSSWSMLVGGTAHPESATDLSGGPHTKSMTFEVPGAGYYGLGTQVTNNYGQSSFTIENVLTSLTSPTRYPIK